MRTLLLLLSMLLALNLSSCVVNAQPVKRVAIVKTAPKHSKIVVVKGKRYHYWNGKYYKRTKKGYVVVRV